jgi:hypothetical protein
MEDDTFDPVKFDEPNDWDDILETIYYNYNGYGDEIKEYIDNNKYTNKLISQYHVDKQLASSLSVFSLLYIINMTRKN